MATSRLIALLLVAVQQAVFAVHIPRERDVSLSPRERAEQLLEQMTWEEKIGQMGGIRRLAARTNNEITFNRTAFDEIHELQNGMIGFGSTFNQPRDVLPLANRIRAEQINSTRLGIPYATVMDSVNGILLVNGTLFPSTLSMASSWNLPLYGDAIAAIRDENLALGVQWVLSPELDIAKDPRNGRVGEMYGEDPYLVGEFGSKYVQTMQEKDDQGFTKIATTVKHFVYGQSSGGINMASMFGGVNHIFNELAAPYIKVIKAAKPLSLMTSYATVDLVPMSANEYMIQNVLREAMEFDGVIMSDAIAIRWLYDNSRVASSMEEAGLLALRAGLQLELSPRQPAVFPTLVDYRNNTSVADQVDRAVLDILQLKFETGLFDKPLPTLEAMEQTLRAPHHLQVNRNMSRESIVLLQNDGLLPLNKNNATKIALLGPFSDLINAGSYAANLASDPSFGNSLRRSLVAELGSDSVEYLPAVDIVDTTDDSGIEEAVSAAKNAGMAVLMLGSLSTNLDDPIATKRTDGEFFAHADVGFPGLQQQLLDAVLDAGVQTTLILSGGQAFSLNNSTLRANAIMHSFLGGEYTGDSLVEILFGKVNPSGKLPLTMPQDSGAWPIAYDYLYSDSYSGLETFGSSGANDWQLPVLDRDDPPFPFGFGLGYTSFDISTPVASSQASNGTSSFVVSVDVSNTGSVVGKEVVQLYFRQHYTHILETPNKKLIGFTKIELSPGESQNVTFTVPFSDLGYYFNTKWRVDSGLYSFFVGSSSKTGDLKTVNVTIPDR